MKICFAGRSPSTAPFWCDGKVFFSKFARLAKVVPERFCCWRSWWSSLRCGAEKKSNEIATSYACQYSPTTKYGPSTGVSQTEVYTTCSTYSRIVVPKRHATKNIPWGIRSCEKERVDLHNLPGRRQSQKFNRNEITGKS